MTLPIIIRLANSILGRFGWMLVRRPYIISIELMGAGGAGGYAGTSYTACTIECAGGGAGGASGTGGTA